MIDLNSQLPLLEKLMKLMKKHNITDLSLDYIHLVRETPETVAKPRNIKQPHQNPGALDDLNEHLQSLPDEPWKALTEDDINPYLRTGQV